MADLPSVAPMPPSDPGVTPGAAGSSPPDSPEPNRSSGPNVTPPSPPVAPPRPHWLDARVGLPEQRTILRWLLVGRAALAGTTLVQAALSWQDQQAGSSGPDIVFLAFATVLLAFAVTAYGAFIVLIKKERPSLGFLQGQAALDLLLVTALVHFAGAHQSGWTALYVLVLALYALLMPLRSGLVMALFGSALFLADAAWAGKGELSTGLWAQVGVFTIVFSVVAVLGQRLRASADEQTQLETELRRVRLEADEILRNIRSGVMTVDGEGRLAFINPTAEQILSLSAEQYSGRPVLEELEQRSPELFNAVVTGIRKGRRVARAEGVVRRQDGRTFPIGLSTTTFERPLQTLPSVTAIFTDISDLQYLQELRVRAERLEAVAALSASLAHEIRNPLASIRSSVEQLARSSYDDPDDRILADLIVRESDRLSRLLGEFLDFSRVRVNQFRVVNLYAVVKDAARLVREHPDCTAGIHVRVEGEPTLLQGDEDLLHRIAWNLLLNAVQALHGAGGHGHISATIDLPPAAELPRGSEFDQAVRLKVTDDGPGVDPELRDQLFQPFVSGRTGGSGLGLAIVQRAVEAHRGLVLLDSAPGQGTTFTILLHAKWPTEDVA